MTRITFIIPRDLINTQPFKNTPLVAPYLLTILEDEFGDRVKLYRRADNLSANDRSRASRILMDYQGSLRVSEAFL